MKKLNSVLQHNGQGDKTGQEMSINMILKRYINRPRFQHPFYQEERRPLKNEQTD